MDFRKYINIEELTVDIPGFKKIEQKTEEMLLKESAVVQSEIRDLFTGIRRRPKHFIFRNNWILSIVFSVNGYCHPRKNLDIYEYDSLEIAIFKGPDSKENLIGFENISKNKDFSDFKEKNEFDKYFDGCVYAYVPIALIQKLFDYMTENFELII